MGSRMGLAIPFHLSSNGQDNHPLGLQTQVVVMRYWSLHPCSGARFPFPPILTKKFVRLPYHHNGIMQTPMPPSRNSKLHESEELYDFFLEKVLRSKNLYSPPY